MRTLEEIPAQVSRPANVPRESDLQTGTDLTSKTILVFCGGESEYALLSINLLGLVIVAAKHTAEAAPSIGRETRTVKGITQREGRKRPTHGVVKRFIMFFLNDIGAEIIREQMASAASEAHTFQTNAEVTVEEIFYVQPPAPGMIATEKAIVGAKDGFIVSLFPSRTVTLGSGECISAPQADVPFRTRIPFRARAGCICFIFLPV
jgi:hypothetical protein